MTADEQDAADARHALAMATQLAGSIQRRDDPWQDAAKLQAISDNWTAFADAAYAWLRNRVSLRVTPATPPDGQPPMPPMAATDASTDTVSAAGAEAVTA